MATLHRTGWIKPLTYALIIMIGPLLVYYLLYVQGRSEILLNRAFTHFANITQLTEARFNSMSSVLSNACFRGSTVRNSIDRSDFALELISNAREASTVGSVPCYNSARTELSISRNTLNFSLPELQEQSTQDGVSYSIGAQTGAVVGEINLGALFHDVLIVDEEQVVYQKHPEKGRIESLQSLRGESEATAEGERLDSDIVSDPLDDMRISYRGRSYLLLTQPMEVNFGLSGSEPVNWSMVGLVEEQRFNDLKMQFQPSTVALFALMVTVLGLSAPFLKIWNMGRFESFRKLDLGLLVASGFTLCSLLTLTGLNYFARDGMQAFMDQKLTGLSKEMTNDVHEELELVLQELRDAEAKMRHIHNINYDLFYKSMDTKKVVASQACPYLASSDLLGEGEGMVSYYSFAGDLLANENGYAPGTYPYFNQVYLMDRNGCQITKYDTTVRPTNASRFVDREYFQNSLVHPRLPLQGYTLQKESLEEPQGEELQEELQEELPERPPGESAEVSAEGKQVEQGSFFMEFITSRTTGEKSLAISIPVTDKDNGQGNGSPREKCLRSSSELQYPCVAVMTTSTLRALQPVLPIGFGFALTDSAGNILFHHEGRNNTEINLADEIGEGSQLISALYGSSTQSFSSDYRGQVHRFHAAPLGIEGSDLHLVSYYSQNMAMLPALEAAGVAMVAWLVMFALLLFMVFWGLQALKRYGFRFTRFTGLFRYIRRHPIMDMVVFTVLVTLVCVLPIYGLHNVAYQEALAGFYQLHQADGGAQRGVQEAAKRSWMETRKTANDNTTRENWDSGKNFLGKCLDRTWKNHLLFHEPGEDADECQDSQEDEAAPAPDTLQGQAGEQLDSPPDASDETISQNPNPPEASDFQLLARWILGSYPDFSEETIRLHAMYRSNTTFASNGGDESRNLAEKFKHSRNLNDLSDQASLENWIGRSGGTSLIIITVIALLVSLRYVLQRVLGAENYFRHYEFKAPDFNAGIRHIVFSDSESSRPVLFSGVDEDRLAWIDLRVLPDDEAIEEVSLRNDNGDIVVLDHFDDCLNDPETVTSRIAVLEQLIRDKQLSIILMARTDPLTYVTAAYQNGEHAELISRLASVLSQFDVSYFRDRPVAIGESSPQDRLLKEECCISELHGVYQSIHDAASHSNLHRDQIVELVKSRANAIYQHMWNLSTRSEKIMLVELANENLVNPNNWDVAMRLNQRGLLKRDPLHRIFNESFKQFVLRMERLENIATWRQESESTWRNIRAPLFVLVIGALVFLASTQPSFVNSVVAFAAAGAASMPFLINLIMQRLARDTGK